MTIGKQITLGFVAVLAVLAGMCALSANRISSIVSHSRFLSQDALPGLQSVGDILNYAQENYVSTLKGVLSEDPREKETYAAAIQANIVKIDDLTNKYAATITLKEDTELFGRLIQARSEFVTTSRSVAALSKAGQNKEAIVLIREHLQPAYDRYEHAIEAVVDFNKENATRACGSIADTADTSRKETFAGTCIALVLGISVTVFVPRRINRALRRTAESLDSNATQTTSASGQLAATSQSLAEGASEQAASLEETSAALEEINSMVGRNAESAAKAKILTAQTRQAADAGAAGLKNLDEAMQAIQTSSSSIAKIIKSIDEIAFQTNILALNAAVEAARAGEAGAGFSVVADEVRSLAQRAAFAARETAEKIESAIGKTTQGVEAGNHLGENIREIIEKARSVDDLVGEIAQASKEQADGISQVNTAVVQMDRVTQTNAANAEESASASEELNVQAASMQESVTELLSLIGGRGKQGVPANRFTLPVPHAAAPAFPNTAATTGTRAGEPKAETVTHTTSTEAHARNATPAGIEDSFKSF